jgi:hypothetical protein
MPKRPSWRDLLTSSRGRIPCSNHSPTSAARAPHELAHRVADRALLVVEQRVDGEEVARIERGCPSS